MKKEQKSAYDKRIQRRGIGLIAAAVALAFGLQLLGILLGNRISKDMALMVFTGSVCLPLLWLPVSLLLGNWYVKRVNARDESQLQTLLLNERERAEEVSVQGLKKLRRLRMCSDALAVLFVLCGVAASVSSGVVYSSNIAIVRLYGGFLWILCGLSQIRFPAPKEIFTDNKTYVDEAEYPQLYALAKRAEEALGCHGKIAIALRGDLGCGIARIGDTYSVQMGAMLLEMLSEEELYAVLLHEFGHMKAENKGIEQERAYFYFICKPRRNPHVLDFFVDWMFRFADNLYMFEHFLFDYACSVLHETMADRAMTEHGDVRYAASALLKMKYYDLYDWEQGVEDDRPFYEQPEAPKHVVSDQLKQFRAALEKRAEAWDALVDCEIISRSASHPTLKMRLETLGVTEWCIAESHDTEEYRAECTKAREYVEQMVYENGKESYKTERIEEYLKPAARVATWEEAGKPLVPAGYADMVGDLRMLGRNREAEALCSRAIAELDEAAACYAYFMRGLARLHRYDPAGMDDLYRAIANNSNYINEGLEAIGEFCCLTGRQEELDTYRERAVQIGQHQKDVYSEMNVLRKKDRIVPEQELPEELRTGLLETIHTVDNGTIEAVYLVRKIITEDFFATAVVVRFFGAPREQRDEIFHKLFRYLDTCSDWQFTLFDYDEVKKIKVERIPNSCIYQKERDNQ